MSTARTLSHYELIEKIGAGGMGEVWRARDQRLDREVAVKLLPAQFTEDEGRLRRFEREAKLLAQLSHPHVAQIHEVDQVGDDCFLVLELVRGESLAQRLQRGPLGVSEAVDVCRQIAEGVEAAHEAGVIHRDLKPANVCIDELGVVKVLDFGLARAGSTSGSGLTATSHDSDSFELTSEGVVLGTPTYMAPEQARGRKVDRRADVWAFGCLLYECLTGQRAFLGDTTTDVLGAVLHSEPHWAELPRDTPARVRELLHRCLAKDPRQRLRDIGEARIALTALDTDSDASAATTPAGHPRSAVTLVVAVLCLAAGFWVGRELAPPSTVTAGPSAAFDVIIENGDLVPGVMAVSPDGAQLVFGVQDRTGSTQLWLRPLDGFDARPLPGTVGGMHPFWSPDSREIGFFSSDRLFRVQLDGTAPRAVANTGPAVGATWNRKGQILYGQLDGPIQRVDASGGVPTPVTTVDESAELMHIWPRFLPDGRHFVFLSDSLSDEGHRVYLASLDGEPPRVLRTVVRSSLEVDLRGALLLVHEGQLLAHPFDVAEPGELGPPVLVADGVYAWGERHDGAFALSDSGVLAYQRGTHDTEIAIHDETGSRVESLSGSGVIRDPEFSPSGRHVAFVQDISGSAGREVWIHDRVRGLRTRISEIGDAADSPVWTPDGQVIYWSGFNGRHWSVLRRRADAARPAETVPLPENCKDGWVLDISQDGRGLLISAGEDALTTDDANLYVLDPADKSATWQRLDHPGGSLADARFSPDGRWIAYTQDEPGPTEVYLTSIEHGPDARRLQVSVSGGAEPRWSADGNRVIYRSLGQDVLAVAVDLQDGRMSAGTPEALFQMSSPVDDAWRNSFAISRDGKLVAQVVGSDERSPAIRVRTDWTPFPVADR